MKKTKESLNKADEFEMDMNKYFSIDLSPFMQIDELIYALQIIFNDQENDLIPYWVYDLNCGEKQEIIEYNNKPIGEMNYIRMDEKACEMGIKICEADMQNRGIGKLVLSLFIKGLFEELGYDKICLDTNLNNKRAQHVYEQLGFQKVRVNLDSWKDQLGNLQSSVEYELVRDTFDRSIF